ncbi:hypothetical protein GCM10010171_14210 [Actinokineospora fastidiosa]|uniref:Tachylectin 2 domain-containing protein n=1 Tax=Actinokineospora fastidiosa TaxID=1816 RepID=A0A918G892_9PSEU|nr:hypothetical protein GCM10010171_14210 [Actinokineospora fastidiosa]
MFVGLTDNGLRFRNHNEPGTGRNNWTGDSAIGNGWTGRFLAGPQGAVYHINSSGVLHRYKYVEGQGWESINGTLAEAIDTGWQNWNTAANRYRLTVDANNHFYAVMPNGDLQRRVYDIPSKTWTREVIDTGWDRFDQVFASGSGVLYARNPSVGDGTLYRFHYDPQTRTWLQREHHIATGWLGFKQLSSPGGDVIYALNSTGNITWYRYLPAEQTWAHNDAGQWKAAITSWSNVDEIAPASDGCRLDDIGASVQCQPRAEVFYTTTTDEFRIYYHNEPETGLGNSDGTRSAAPKWDGRVMSGPDGYRYLLRADGVMTRQRWTGTGWANNGVGEYLARDWTGYSSPETRFRITVDSNNHFYAVRGDGSLEHRVYNETAGTWATEVIDTGWGRFNHVFAAGDGVLFARDPSVFDGGLYRFHYDWQNRRWVEHGKRIGSGWAGFKQLASPGGGIVYALTSTGQVAWYHYDHEAGTFVPGARGNVRENITTLSSVQEIAPAIDTCELTNPVTVTPPQPGPPDNERAHMMLNPRTDVLEIAFVTDQGVLMRAVQRTQGVETVDPKGMAEYFSYTGNATLGFRDDGRLMLLGLGQDGQIRAHTQDQIGGSGFSNPLNLKGAMLSSPVLASGAGNLLTAFAVDEAGSLWYASQLTTSGGLSPWRKAAGEAQSLTTDFSVVRNGDAFEVVYRRADGAVAAARFQGGALQAPRVATGLVTGDIPSAVLFADGKLQIIARGAADNLVYTQREGAAGFPGWLAIGGLTIAGSPHAVLNQYGIIEVVARATDGDAYRTGQTAPGSASWRIWEGSDRPAVTDPVIALAGAENRYFFQDDVGNAYLVFAQPYPAQPSAAMAAGAPEVKQVKKVDQKVTTFRVGG